MDTKPSSFCSLSTKPTAHELELLLGTLSLYHAGARVYCMVDTYTHEHLKNMWFNETLKITYFNCLDAYTDKTRSSMEEDKEVTEFWNYKNRLMEVALEDEPDTLFLDADQVVLNEIKLPNNDKKLGLCKQNIPISNSLQTGYYNAGFVWCSDKIIPKYWRRLNEQSSYVDQKSLEMLKMYFMDDSFEFGDNYNLMPWTKLLNAETKEDFSKRFLLHDGQLFYNFKKLTTIHTHFTDQRFKEFNETILNLLTKNNSYRELALIHKSLTGTFTITIPKQPRSGIYRHANDSFRELAVLASQSPDAEFVLNESSNTNHCWLEPNILLNDRPTLEWVDKEFVHAQCVLIGNGDIEVEGASLKHYASVKPWIFWPRNPRLLENYINSYKVRSFTGRKHLCTFIGNIENSTQEKHRNSNDPFGNLCDIFELSVGSNHKYSQKEYLDILGSSKFGLCLQGYGKKCHREIECMALGTVPVIHHRIPTHSFAEPLIENIHFIKYTQSLTQDNLNKIPDHQWDRMSKACQEWYYRNCHSKTFFRKTLATIFNLS